MVFASLDDTDCNVGVKSRLHYGVMLTDKAADLGVALAECSASDNVSTEEMYLKNLELNTFVWEQRGNRSRNRLEFSILQPNRAHQQMRSLLVLKTLSNPAATSLRPKSGHSYFPCLDHLD